MRNWGRNC